MKARIYLTLKEEVLDPQGNAVHQALLGLNFSHVESVRQGKIFDISLKHMPKIEAEEQLKAMCEKLLANTLIENYHIEFI